MIKKLLNIILISMLLVFSVPNMVLAEDTVEVETTAFAVNVTDDSVEVGVNQGSTEESSEEENEEFQEDSETIILSDNFGVKMRLLQLKSRTSFQIESANLVLARLEELGKLENIDSERTDEILIELEGIVLEIEEFDYELSTEEIASTYVALKDRVNELSLEFKGIVSSQFTPEEVEFLRQIIQDNNKIRLQIKDETIDELKKNFNANRVKNILNRLGIDNLEILEQIKNGEISVEDVKVKIKSKVDSLDSERKNEAMQKLVEENKRLRIEVKELKSEIKEKKVQKKEEIKVNFENRREELKEKYEIKIKEDRIRLKTEFGEMEVRSDGRVRIRNEDGKLEVGRNGNLNVGNTIDKIESLREDAKDNIEAAKEEIQTAMEDGQNVDEAEKFLEKAEKFFEDGVKAFEDKKPIVAEKFFKDASKNAIWAMNRGLNIDISEEYEEEEEEEIEIEVEIEDSENDEDDDDDDEDEEDEEDDDDSSSISVDVNSQNINVTVN